VIGGKVAGDRGAEADAQRAAQVWARLDAVSDPELDEPVTDLGFVTHVSVHPGGAVDVGFRLPTYWCAGNFAFLMADDMRRAVAALPWVTRVGVSIGEHLYADAINRGMAGGLSFQETFGDEASGDVEALRQSFAVKAFQRRQEALLRHLLAAGHDAAALLALSVDELAAYPVDDAGENLVERYLSKRGVIGAASQPAERGKRLAFVDSDGAALAPQGIEPYLRALRRVGINMEFNGALCRGLLAARFGEDLPTVVPKAKPIHFVRTRAGKPG
jgi:metal-sulfur cluster biosynthetic enzyme